MMRDMCPNPMMEMMGNMMFNTMGGFGNNGFGDFNDQQGFGQNRNGRGHGRGSFGNGREGFGGFADMDAGFGTSGMSDYTSDYNDGPHPAANMPVGMSDLTDDEREFMMGSGGFGRGGFSNQRRGGGMMGGFRGGRGGANFVNQNENSAAFGGRRIKIEGLEENHTDEIVMRYFRKFGVVDE